MEEVFKVQLDGLISLPQIENAVKKAINEFKGNKLAKFDVSEFQEQLQTAPAQLIELARALDKSGKSEERLMKLQQKVDAQNKKDEKNRQKQLKAAIKLATASKGVALGLKLMAKGIQAVKDALGSILKIAKLAAFALAGVTAIIGGISSLVNKAMDIISKSITKSIKAMPVYRLSRSEFEALNFTEQANSTGGGLADTLKSFNASLNDINKSGAFATLGLNLDKYAKMPSGKDAFLSFLKDTEGVLSKYKDGDPFKKLILDQLDDITGGNSDFLRGILANKDFTGNVSKSRLPMISGDFRNYDEQMKGINWDKQLEQSRAYNKAVTDIGFAFQKVAIAVSPVVGSLFTALSKSLLKQENIDAINNFIKRLQTWAETANFDGLFRKIERFFTSIYRSIKWVAKFLNLFPDESSAKEKKTNLDKKLDTIAPGMDEKSKQFVTSMLPNQAKDILSRGTSKSMMPPRTLTPEQLKNVQMSSTTNVSIHLDKTGQPTSTSSETSIGGKATQSSLTTRTK